MYLFKSDSLAKNSIDSFISSLKSAKSGFLSTIFSPTSLYTSFTVANISCGLSVSRICSIYLFLESLLNLADFIMPSKFLALSPIFLPDSCLPGAKSKNLLILLGMDERKSPPTPIIPVNKLSAAVGLKTAATLLACSISFLAPPTSVSLPNSFLAIRLEPSPSKFGCIGSFN